MKKKKTGFTVAEWLKTELRQLETETPDSKTPKLKKLKTIKKKQKTIHYFEKLDLEKSEINWGWVHSGAGGWCRQKATNVALAHKLLPSCGFNKIL